MRRPAPPAPEPHRFFLGITFAQLMVGLLFGAIAVCACLMPTQSDTFWHLRAGQEIVRTAHVPLEDSYSFTANGQFWPNHEWLWQAFTFALYASGGMRLLVAGGAALVIGASAIAYRLMVGPTSTRFALVLVGLPMATCAWAVRPQIASLLLLMVMLWLMVREVYQALPILFWVWANLHGAVAMGGAVLVAVTALAIVRAWRGDAVDRSRAFALVVVAPFCAIGISATPLGFRLWKFIGASIAASKQNKILEWQPTWPDGAFGIAFWVLAAAFIAVLIWRRKRLREAGWGDLVLYTAALVMLPLAFRAVRNTSVFLLIAIPAASRLLGPEFRFRRRPPAAQSADHPRFNLGMLVGVSLVEIAAVVLAWQTSFSSLGWHPISDGALEAVRGCRAQVYNRYNEGGYLIWFAPERQVFVDSRQDPYPPALMRELLDVDHGGPYRPLFERFDVRCAFLPADSKTIPRLLVDGWHTRFSDDKWAVLFSPGAG
jgi:hypothetical protein